VRNSVSLNSRVQWRLGPGEQFSLQPLLVRSESHSEAQGTLTAASGSAPAPYATRTDAGDLAHTVTRLNVQLLKRLAPDTRIDLSAAVGGFSLTGHSLKQTFDGAGGLVLAQASDTLIRDRSWSLNGKLMQQLGDGHSLVGGWELAGVRRTENVATALDGSLQAGDLDAALQASTRRTALYLQDEWDPAPNWSANLGLRSETLDTRSLGSIAPVDNRSRVLSPLAHLVWRFAAPQRDQLRLSLTQSYRAPTLQELIAAPRFNTTYPVPGGNVASSADTAGNAGLRPETANGIDLAYEHYLRAGGIVSVNLFYRRIRNLIRSVTQLEDVAWASEPRWVSRPQNLGRASTRGMEFDAKFRLNEWFADALPVNLRMNLSLYDSHVESVPGPDNRINQQPRATGNFGADLRLPGTAWTLGGSLAVTPGYRTQLTELQSQELGPRRVLDAYLLWQANPATRWRLSLANLTPRDSLSSTSVLQDTQLQTRYSTGRTDLAASMRLEMKL
jgi:outer membrane receptor for ferrienterochelin and colicins